MARRRRGDPHQVLISGLSSTARKLALEGVPRQEALAFLRGMADGRTDVLVEAGGRAAGNWFGRPELDPSGINLATAALLLSAGVRVDSDDLKGWVQVGYDLSSINNMRRA
ncbi:hypothetical protein [Microlunatus sp. GCM10028923]|uniref:hypothetical protein n=1 Tax=Microlunatus sp. GCM10028923 TaxID=3273400 RepID=UPI003606D435